MNSAASLQRSSTFFGGSATAIRAAGRPRAYQTRVARQQVQVQALFGFGSKKSDSSAGTTSPYYICIDCGWIYPDGDIKKAPGSFRCPACNSPKSRFKVYKGKVAGKPNNTGAAMKKRFAAKEW